MCDHKNSVVVIIHLPLEFRAVYGPHTMGWVRIRSQGCRSSVLLPLPSGRLCHRYSQQGLLPSIGKWHTYEMQECTAHVSKFAVAHVYLVFFNCQVTCAHCHDRLTSH